MILNLYLWSTGVALTFAITRIGLRILLRDRWYTYGHAMTALGAAVLPAVQWAATVWLAVETLVDAAEWITNNFDHPIVKKRTPRLAEQVFTPERESLDPYGNPSKDKK